MAIALVLKTREVILLEVRLLYFPPMFKKGNKYRFKKGNKVCVGRIISKKTRQKMRKSLKGRIITWGNEISKSLIGNQNTKGKHWKVSKEGRKNIIKGNIEKWKNLEFKEKTKKKISEGCIKRFRDPKEREKMRQIRLLQIIPTKDTSIEVKMQEALRKIGIQFEKHKPLLNKYQVDLFIEPNLVIECDGDYYHNFPEGTDSDRKKDIALKKAGYKVLRFWEHEINNSIEECIQNIINLISYFKLQNFKNFKI